MKKLVITLIAITGMLVLVSSCKNMNKKESTKSASTGSEKITSTEVSSDLIVYWKRYCLQK